MNKKILPLILCSIFLIGCEKIIPADEFSYSSNTYSFTDRNRTTFEVAFMYNFNKQEINFNSGLYATGNSVAFKIDIVNKGSKAVKPDLDPLRRNYVFDGWHTDPNESSLWNFDNDVINSNTYLYAHWTLEQEEEFIEPEWVDPSNHINDGLQNLGKVKSVMHFNLENDNSVKLPTGAISRLDNYKEDVLQFIDYETKSGCNKPTATYANNKITFKVTDTGGTSYTEEINVVDNSASWVVNNSTYETKAQKYEQKGVSIENHHIMLAGSSSMENWSTSTEDLLPLTTYNHGIGGTTVEQWKKSLNARLVYPYMPKTVVYYVGVNNIINSHDSASTIIGYLNDMFTDVHNHMPDSKIYYVLINALPGYMSYINTINSVNNAVKQFEANHDYLTTLNPGQLLLKDNGNPNAAFFLTDGLHMSKYGYVLWGGYIKEQLIKDMSND